MDADDNNPSDAGIYLVLTLNEEIRVLGIRKEPYQHVRVYGKMG